MLDSFAVFISYKYFALLTDAARYEFNPTQDPSKDISNKLQANLCAYVPCKH